MQQVIRRLQVREEISGLPRVITSTCKYMLQVQLFAPKLKMEGPLLLPWPHAPKLCCMSSHQSPTAGSGCGPSGWGGSTGEGDTRHPPLPRWGGNCPARACCASPVLTGGPEGPLGPSFPVSPGGPRAPGGPGGPGGPVAPSRP